MATNPDHPFVRRALEPGVWCADSEGTHVVLPCYLESLSSAAVEAMAKPIMHAINDNALVGGVSLDEATQVAFAALAALFGELEAEAL